MSELHGRLIWLACCVVVLAVAYQIRHISFQTPSGVLKLSVASFTQAGANQVAVQKTLPDNWQWHNNRTSHGFYRVQFSIADLDNSVKAILIPTVRSNVSVALNGEKVGDGGSMQPPIASNLRKPLMFVVPHGLLQTGNNILEVELKSSVSGKGFLDAIFVGPHAALNPAFKRHNFYRITLVESITYGLLITTLVIAILAGLRPQNKEYAWFALATFLWAAHNATNHITNIVVSNHVWDWFSYVTLGWFALVAPVVLARFKQQIHPRFERFLLSLAIVLPLLMLVLPQPAMHAMADYLWYPLAFSIGGGALLFVAIDAWKTNDLESQLLTASGLFIIPYALHDLLIVQAVLPWEDGFYIQFGAVVLLAVFTMILLYRLVRSTNEAELLNLNLSDEVSKKTQEIQAAMERTRLLEKNEWLSDERARITRDMHDGFAGQIASVLSTLKSGRFEAAEVETQLEYSINDLRLMIDSLDNEENDLVTLLGMFRYRANPMLEQAGIELDWVSLPPDTRIELLPATALHLLRIMQEALQNAVRHANCTRIKISATHNPEYPDEVLIRVQDNGVGIATELLDEPSKGKHRGLRNMRYRAEQINAALDICSTDTGTSLSLTLPAERLDQPSS